MKLWKTIAVAAAVMLGADTASAQAPEKKDIKHGVGGAPALYYLPLALTDSLGYFKEQGLNVEINDFKGGSQSLTALVGGSADVVTGAYEHTLRMQAKGLEWHESLQWLPSKWRSLTAERNYNSSLIGVGSSRTETGRPDGSSSCSLGSMPRTW